MGFHRLNVGIRCGTNVELREIAFVFLYTESKRKSFQLYGTILEVIAETYGRTGPIVFESFIQLDAIFRPCRLIEYESREKRKSKRIRHCVGGRLGGMIKMSK